jgi:hypothetical protein
MGVYMVKSQKLPKIRITLNLRMVEPYPPFFPSFFSYQAPPSSVSPFNIGYFLLMAKHCYTKTQLLMLLRMTRRCYTKGKLLMLLQMRGHCYIEGVAINVVVDDKALL